VAKNISCENDDTRESTGSRVSLPIHTGAVGPEPETLYTPEVASFPQAGISTGTHIAHTLTSSYGENVLGADGYPLPDLTMNDAFAFDDALMGDFLRDIIHPSPDSTNNYPNQPGHDVLNFGFVTQPSSGPYIPDWDPGANAFHEADFTGASRPRSGAVTPTVQRDINIGQQAFKDSFWLWVPASDDNRSAQQRFSAIAEEQVIEEAQNLDVSASLDISLPTRDRLLSLVLSTCEAAVQRHVLSRFPSAELITSILTSFVALRFDEVGWWIHAPSLDIDQEHEVFLAGLLTAAAAESHHNDIRRLGLAVQEAARISAGNRFEEDNRTTRDLKTLQTVALQLHAGFWSGMRRKMEIAESFTFPLVTMLRRSGRFQRMATRDHAEAEISDEESWHEWIEYESFKRLVYHILIQDTTMSMSLLSQPLISTGELQLDLPSTSAAWAALSAEEWRRVASINCTSSVPTIRDALQNLRVLVDHQNIIDVQLSLDILVCSLWARVWQYRQIKSAPLMSRPGSISTAIDGLQRDLVQDFKYVKMESEEWAGGISPYVSLKLEVCLMHLYVSLEDIQIFGGKEGESAARKTVPQLQSWSQTIEARQALYHAGQALKTAALFAPGTLRGFAAVAVYHASLVLWAYGILIDPKSRNFQPPMFVRIDVDGAKELDRFIMTGQGIPCITDYSQKRDSHDSATTLLTNPPKVMSSISSLLCHNAGNDHYALPIVTHLSKLMRSLGRAAGVMKRPQT
jgi:hypothetical protein